MILGDRGIAATESAQSFTKWNVQIHGPSRICFAESFFQMLQPNIGGW